MQQTPPLKEHQLIRLFLTVATLVTLVSMFVFAITKGTRNELSLTPDREGIVGDSLQIQSVHDIGEWEFLTLSDEELVDTTASRLLGSDRQLTRIYYGTLRLGVDMGKLSPGALRLVGDTLDVTLPPIGLLDDDFIDETRTKSFHEKGSWDEASRAALYQRAKRQMLSRCLTDRNLSIARQNAVEEVSQMFHTLGYSYVNVHFQP
ncbi:MAG: DUF4230 domain-containing protein [Prevotella sp.]|jgi:hypothetical protein|nr:DUF4230 domain-containing protein [Prevotella sp.]